MVLKTTVALLRWKEKLCGLRQWKSSFLVSERAGFHCGHLFNPLKHAITLRRQHLCPLFIYLYCHLVIYCDKSIELKLFHLACMAKITKFKTIRKHFSCVINVLLSHCYTKYPVTVCCMNYHPLGLDCHIKLTEEFGVQPYKPFVLHTFISTNVSFSSSGLLPFPSSISTLVNKISGQTGSWVT
jgi:hypothetical protein